MAQRICRSTGVYMVRLDDQDRKQLDTLAETLRMDRSDVVRQLIRGAQVTTPRINIQLGQVQGV